MHLGYFSMNTLYDEAPGPLARALEEAGYESLWFGEHPHIPCERRTPYPAGGDMPAPYRSMLNPLISLSMAAAVTSRLRLGTGVLLPLEHDVFDLAKTIATLDNLSNGRVLIGVGTGWNVEELANCRPIPWSERYRALEECVNALIALWAGGEAQFHGRYFDFDPVWSQPVPAQRPHPPILCGMAGKMGTQHALRWADGWMPLDIGLGNVEKKLGLFRTAAAATGSESMPITIVASGNPSFDTLLAYRDLGVARVIVGVAREGMGEPETTYPFVTRYSAFIPRL